MIESIGNWLGGVFEIIGSLLETLGFLVFLGLLTTEYAPLALFFTLLWLRHKMKAQFDHNYEQNTALFRKIDKLEGELNTLRRQLSNE